MKEIHGLAGVTRLAVGESNDQAVTVRDGADPQGNARVELCLSTSSYPAGLTPDEAHFLARQLTEAAVRAEQANKGSK